MITVITCDGTLRTDQKDGFNMVRNFLMSVSFFLYRIIHLIFSRFPQEFPHHLKPILSLIQVEFWLSEFADVDVTGYSVIGVLR